MSQLSLRDLQGISQYSNTVRIPSGHSLSFDGNLKMPTWSSATKPSSPTTGLIGWNTTLKLVEIYDGTTWVGSSGGALGSSAANPATSAVALVNAGITTDGVYYIKASPSAPTQQVYCILDSRYDGGGWMIIANCPATTYSTNAGHIPRPTAFPSYVGTSGANSYSSNLYFSVNAQDMSFTKFYHVVMSDNTSFNLETKCIGYVGHHLNVSRTIPTTQSWVIDSVGTSMTRGTLVTWPGFGNKRARFNATNVSGWDGTPIGFGVLPSGANTVSAPGGNSHGLSGSGGLYYPAFVDFGGSGGGISYYTFAFTDAYGTTPGAAQQAFGFDDWQDGSGQGDVWDCENTSQSTARGKPSFIMIK